MTSPPEFDHAAAHRFFAADCFNRAWDLMDLEQRTTEQERLMVALNQASIYHWLQRSDCTPRRLSVGYWQASRIQVLLDHAVEALRQAEVCLSFSGDLEPFYQGYAYEAMARAEALANRLLAAADYRQQALDLAAKVDDPDDRKRLTDDLATL